MSHDDNPFYEDPFKGSLGGKDAYTTSLTTYRELLCVPPMTRWERIRHRVKFFFLRPWWAWKYRNEEFE